MRIIAGRLRGKKLKSPKGLVTRPVLARVREALFNILGDIEGARFLDLYAGTGAIGIEAISRGAEAVTFVERGATQCRIIRENLGAEADNTVVIRSDASRVLNRLAKDGVTFDVVFADPPYDLGLTQDTINAVCQSNILAEAGILAVTSRRDEKLPETACFCEMVVDKRYGDTRLTFYKKTPKAHEKADNDDIGQPESDR